MNIRHETIVVVPSSLTTYITGMGYVWVMSGEDDDSAPRNLPLLESSPPYMAPERTGRLKRPVDGRADLYACDKHRIPG